MTCPFQGWFIIRKLGLAMSNLHTKLVVCTFTYYENAKGSPIQNVEIGVVRGLLRSLAT